VDGFVDTPVGPVPHIHTVLSKRDIIDTIAVRFGWHRYAYRVTPGLYAVGTPTPDSPVIVTANYKLTFDVVRKELRHQNLWLLVADTRGINVWCAAGKGLFSTEEIVLSVRESRLAEVVDHRELILPQLGATGVAAHKVSKQSAFKVSYGPVQARDLPEFMEAGNVATQSMRTATFTLRERTELIPVELMLLGKPLAIFIAVAFLLSGIGPDFLSLNNALIRSLVAGTTTIAAIITGAMLVPILLPYLPWRAFAPKGALLGFVAGIMCATWADTGIGEGLALVLWSIAIASYLAMNFTGSTPYTSPSGVEKEMRYWLPIQLGAAVVAVIIWAIAPFTA